MGLGRLFARMKATSVESGKRRGLEPGILGREIMIVICPAIMSGVADDRKALHFSQRKRNARQKEMLEKVRRGAWEVSV